MATANPNVYYPIGGMIDDLLNLAIPSNTERSGLDGSAVDQPNTIRDASIRDASTRDTSVRDTSVRDTSTPDVFVPAVAQQAVQSDANSAYAEDHRLIALFQAGDENAFVQLYSRWQAEVFTFCLWMCGGDRDVASDAFQETFIRIYEKAAQFRGDNLKAWILTIARNVCLNLFRTKPPARLSTEHNQLASSDRSLTPEFEFEQETLRRLLADALASLPVDIREPFILREFEGLSYSEIAEQLGITMGATRQRIYRAKQQMREILLPDYGPDGKTKKRSSIDRAMDDDRSFGEDLSYE